MWQRGKRGRRAYGYCYTPEVPHLASAFKARRKRATFIRILEVLYGEARLEAPPRGVVDLPIDYQGARRPHLGVAACAPRDCISVHRADGASSNLMRPIKFSAWTALERSLGRRNQSSERGRARKEVLQGTAWACGGDKFERSHREAKPYQRRILSRSSASSRRYACLHVLLQNLLPHQRCVTMPKRPPQ
jgi:hypothetical protein